MNLNQPINFDLIKSLSFFKHARAIVVIITSAIAVIFFAFQCYALYLNNQDYEQKNIEFIELNNQINSMHKKISKLLIKQSVYFHNLSMAPGSKSELVDQLSNIGASSKVAVRKIIANDNAQNQKSPIEIEVDGSYASIDEFVHRITPLLSASNIELLKLDKRKESQFVNSTLSINFATPPSFAKSPEFLKRLPSASANLVSEHHDVINYAFNDYSLEKPIQSTLNPNYMAKRADPAVAFRLNGEDYFYGSPGEDWKFYTVGFVQQPDPVISPNANVPNANVPNANVPNANVPNANARSREEDVLSKRQDPFLPSPKSNQLGALGSSGSSSATFLSGILYSNKLSLCIVTLSSGESKVFSAGEYINSKVKIKSIKADLVYLQSNVEKAYKVGQEIYAK